jgi:HAD superfamily hydrolase (TIGR01549 family)
MLKRYSVIAFDCDGVRFDTAASNRAYYNALLLRLGLPEMNEEQFVYAHSHAVEDSVAYLVGEHALIREAHRLRRSMNYNSFIKEMAMEPFLLPLLKKMKGRYHTAIATNRTDTMASVLAEFGLGPHFDYVVCASDVAHPKPHPEPLLKIVSRFDIQPHELLYVGDSKVDEQAAASAGVAFAAYDNRPLSADYHIRNLKELQELLFSA